MSFKDFFRSSSPVMSDRVRVILNDRDDARHLVAAIREVRSGKEDTSFTVSDATQSILNEEGLLENQNKR